MYLPARFENKNHREALELANQYPFATLVSVVEEKSFVSHLPLVVQIQGENTFLIGHFAKANPHWRFLKSSPVTVIFHGPNTYITPKWYAEHDVPTWNYAVVHMTGNAELIEDYQGIVDCLKILTIQSEKNSSEPWDFWIPNDLSTEKALCAAIIGFKIKITDIKAKFKLSQNRSDADKLGAIQGLRKRADEMSLSIANLMEQHSLPKK